MICNNNVNYKVNYTNYKIVRQKGHIYKQIYNFQSS